MSNLGVEGLSGGSSNYTVIGPPLTGLQNKSSVHPAYDTRPWLEDVWGDATTDIYDDKFSVSWLCNASGVEVLCNNSTVNLGNVSLFDNETVVTKTPSREIWLIVILAILAGSTSIVTIFGNMIVVMSFVLERTIRQPTNYFIFSLAVSDLLIGAISMNFYTLMLLMEGWPLDWFFCDLWLSIDYTVCLTSQYTVLFITIDRFCSVKFPAKYRNWRTEKKVLTMVAFTWLIPFVIFFTSIFGWQFFVGDRSVPEGECYVQFLEDPLFNCILTIGYFWVTLIAMCSLYTGIYKVALDLQRKSEAKHKKMTSLVSMAGQTMTKIGIGVTRQGNTLTPDSGKRPKKESNHISQKTRTTSTTSFTSNREEKPDEDRSSSPAFPSDIESSSHSDPKQHSPKHRKTSKSKTRSKKKLDVPRGNSYMPIPPPPSVELKPYPYKPTPIRAATKLPIQDTNKHDMQLNIKHNDSNTTSNVGGLPNSNDECLPNQQTPLMTPIPVENFGTDNNSPNQLSPEFNVSSPPEQLHGMKYIDQESLRSLQSSDTIKSLSEQNKSILPEPGKPTNGSRYVKDLESPVWKKRDSFTELVNLDPEPVPNACVVSPRECAHKNGTQTHVPTPPVTPKSPKPSSSIDHLKPISPAARIQVEAVEDKKNGKTITKIANSEDIQALNADSKKDHRGNPFRHLVKHVSSRKSRRKSRREKTAKSKSENRARKALRTITIILGAYVLCWTPYHILVLIMGFCNDAGLKCVPDELYNISYWICYLNSPINPFCYALANAQFKKTFTRILRGDWHKT